MSHLTAMKFCLSISERNIRYVISPLLDDKQRISCIPEKCEKPILSLRTAQEKEYSLDKEQTSYSDLLDGLRLSIKGYNIK